MYSRNKYIRFEETGESFTCRRGVIKQNAHNKLYLEVYDVSTLPEGKYKLKINDYLSNSMQNIRCAYIEVVCKDVERQYVDIHEASMIDHADVVKSHYKHTSTVDLSEYIERKIEEKEEELEYLEQMRDLL